MTNKDLFRAVGEVREDQIADADTKSPTHWRRYLAAAACFALVLAAALTLPGRLGHTETDLGAGGMDSSEYSTAESADAKPARPEHSVGRRSGSWTPSLPRKSPRRRRTAAPVWPGWSRRRSSPWTR